MTWRDFAVISSVHCFFSVTCGFSCVKTGEHHAQRCGGFLHFVLLSVRPKISPCVICCNNNTARPFLSAILQVHVEPESGSADVSRLLVTCSIIDCNRHCNKRNLNSKVIRSQESLFHLAVVVRTSDSFSTPWCPADK